MLSIECVACMYLVCTLCFVDGADYSVSTACVVCALHGHCVGDVGALCALCVVGGSVHGVSIVFVEWVLRCAGYVVCALCIRYVCSVNLYLHVCSNPVSKVSFLHVPCKTHACSLHVTLCHCVSLL